MNREIRYERDLMHVYMVLPADGEASDYRHAMILENRIPGFLPVRMRQRNGKEEYYYDISSQVSLEEYLEHRPLSADFLRQLVFTICRLPEALRDYLLTEESLVLEPETIFYREDRGQFLLCLYPEGKQEVKASLRTLIKYLMGKADPEEASCGVLCYELYGLLQKENFCLSEFQAALEQNTVSDSPKEPEKKKRAKQFFAGRRNGGIMKPVRREA